MTTKAELLRVIRRQCKDCMAGVESEIIKCTAPNCPLFDFRSGKDPRPSKKRVEMARERYTPDTFKTTTAASE